MSYHAYAYFVDPARLAAVYGSHDGDLAQRVEQRDQPWVPLDDDEDATGALAEIISGAELDVEREHLSTLVMQWICETIGVDAWFEGHLDVEVDLPREPIEEVNRVLGRLGIPDLESMRFDGHPYLSSLPPPDDFPTMEVYSAADCKRVADSLTERWSELVPDEIAIVQPLATILGLRPRDAVLVVFSY